MKTRLAAVALLVTGWTLMSACGAGSFRDPQSACTGTGGMVGSATCCLATGDFPSTCTTGACACAPADSHTVQTCRCPTDRCFDPEKGCR